MLGLGVPEVDCVSESSVGTGAGMSGFCVAGMFDCKNTNMQQF